ncbi:MAG: hypothetical protein KF736_13215 [Acidobacteria bacterium]|nr:hypothetical protein [Acidobacteriota bacterium]MCW5950333.1 hypothetical protein [Pyrinomonadaceae bacterium]
MIRAIRPRPSIAAILIVLAGLAVSIPASRYAMDAKPQLPAEYSDGDLTFDAGSIRGFTFGADGLVADVYFIRALQYIGDKILASDLDSVNLDDLRSLDPRLLHPYLDTATDLDPHYIAAYSYGAVVLPAIDSDKAIALTKKGIANNPDAWRLHQYLGYVYWRLGRYEEAAETYAQGAAIEGAPTFLRVMAAVMQKQGGSRDTARAIFADMATNSADDSIRAMAQRRLAELAALDELDAINAALSKLAEANRRCPATLGEAVPLLREVKLPAGGEFRVDRGGHLVDPTGVPYMLDSKNCSATVDPVRSTIKLEK